MRFTGFHTTHNRIVGQVLRALREVRNCDSNILAKKLAMSKETFNKVENGTKTISLNEFIAWCDAMQIDYGGVLNVVKEIEWAIMHQGGLFKKPKGIIETSPISYEVVKLMAASFFIKSGEYCHINPGIISM